MKDLLGIKHIEEDFVTDDKTALAVGSGSLKVYSTPMVIALIEKAATNSVQKKLDEKLTTVGIEVNIKHLDATPVGAKVRAEAVVEKVEGKKLYFKVEAYDEKGIIAKGNHIRFIVESESFQRRTNEKLKE